MSQDYGTRQGSNGGQNGGQNSGERKQSPWEQLLLVEREKNRLEKELDVAQQRVQTLTEQVTHARGVAEGLDQELEQIRPVAEKADTLIAAANERTRQAEQRAQAAEERARLAEERAAIAEASASTNYDKFLINQAAFEAVGYAAVLLVKDTAARPVADWPKSMNPGLYSQGDAYLVGAERRAAMREKYGDEIAFKAVQQVGGFFGNLPTAVKQVHAVGVNDWLRTRRDPEKVIDLQVDDVKPA